MVSGLKGYEPCPPLFIFYETAKKCLFVFTHWKNLKTENQKKSLKCFKNCTIYENGII